MDTNSVEFLSFTKSTAPNIEGGKSKTSNLKKSPDLPETLSNKELFKACQNLGQASKLARNKFLALLPEVYRRNLHRQKGFLSIYEFGAKLGGVSHASVDKILRLEKRLSPMPKLHHELISGKTSWNKLEKIAYVATPQSQGEWLTKARIMPTRALEIAVQAKRGKLGPIINEVKHSKKIGHLKYFICPKENSENSSHTNKSISSNKWENKGQTENKLFSNEEVTHVSDFEKSWNRLSLNISPEVEKRLKILKQKLEKEQKQALTWNEVLDSLLPKEQGDASESECEKEAKNKNDLEIEDKKSIKKLKTKTRPSDRSKRPIHTC